MKTPANDPAAPSGRPKSGYLWTAVATFPLLGWATQAECWWLACLLAFVVIGSIARHDQVGP